MALTNPSPRTGSGTAHPSPTSARRPIPGPAGLPVIGSLLDLHRDSLGAFLRAQREHGDVVRLEAGPPGLRSVFYAVFAPEGVQQVLATQAANFRKDHPFYEEVRQSFGNGLLTSQDADYLRQRRLVQPLFTRRRVDGYAAAVATEADAVAARWRSAADGVVDLVPELNRLALRTVARILFGVDTEAAVTAIHRCAPVINDYVVRRAYTPVKIPRDWPTPRNLRNRRVTAELNALCDRIIAERRTAPGDATTGEPDHNDLLSLLAAAGNDEDGTLDATEVREQVLIFLLAGHETTATSMAFTLHLLARHPDEQSRVRAEVAHVLGDRTPTAADLDRLPLLTRAFKESMRLYPAAPVVSRRAVEATEVAGFPLPAGADVVVAPWVTHRHPDLWEDPERFDPDRFAPEREAGRHRYAWFPFGGGPRVCIGQHFSMLESVLALATLLRSHELTALDQEVPVAAGITLQATGPARVRLRAL
ncbi:MULTISPECIES: cytochrome P450 [unclassified Streptomyces]|uniref:cytochrome P450 n=1 Tax=unclassified Streptomyces TaxID=2593676 RepID=UPI000382032B|nr:MULTISPECIES: cytochrome P450 [unclassified Streptomyces]MYT29791.1 cytochrome P450 [Streptomyces sp. SID8354]